ncbi:MAG: phenylacetate--CoA ligase family protein [Lautropia sp.]
MRVQTEAGELPREMGAYLCRVAARSDVFRRQLEGIPQDLDLAGFRRVPLADRALLYRDIAEHPPMGSLYSSETARICFTPSPQGLIPVQHTHADLEKIHAAICSILRTGGVNPGDRAAITFGYHLFVAGLLFHGICDAMGVHALPLGPGEAARSAKIINDMDARLLIANPTFALQLAEHGASAPKTLLLTGESMSFVPGLRERLKESYGQSATILEMYGLAELGPVALECPAHNGMHVFEEIHFAEVVDPDTGRVLDEGGTGELVLTPYAKDVPGVVRFRTGDLIRLERRPCACGRSLSLVGGVLGQTHQGFKVKGVKLYTAAVRDFMTLLGIESWQVDIRQDNARDRLTLTVDAAGSDTLTRLPDQWQSRFLFKLDGLACEASVRGRQAIHDHRA